MTVIEMRCHSKTEGMDGSRSAIFMLGNERRIQPSSEPIGQAYFNAFTPEDFAALVPGAVYDICITPTDVAQCVPAKESTAQDIASCGVCTEASETAQAAPEAQQPDGVAYEMKDDAPRNDPQKLQSGASVEGQPSPPPPHTHVGASG